MMRLTMLVALSLGLAATPALAQEETAPEPTIAPIALGIDADGLSGPGADIIREEMAQSQFVMVGEDHGYAGAPQFLGALAAEGADLGFDNYAIEVGPYSTAWLRDVLADGGPDALAKALKGRPLALPFLGNREEAEAAMGFLGEGKLWGVDQEFIGSPLVHLELLGEGGDPALLGDLTRREQEAFSTGNQQAVLMFSMTDAEWDALEGAFAGNESALDRLAQLRRSATVYKHWVTGRGLDNNLDRIEIIREYFLDAYRAAEAREGKPPRVLMKFGATHGSRATTPMNTFDLGPLIEGMAAANGMEALHIAYLPLAGKQLATMPSPDGFFTIKDTDGTKLRALLVQAGVDIAPIEADKGHFLIPTEPVKRALRNKGLAELDGMTRFVVLGFDYILTTSAGVPATPLAER
ncbi:hypothetical protein K3152_12440 [Qipengyuania sp. 1NDH17]|uniref:Erythromycin esterase family protein n=1 Tax=Qipengyuania polymorpha TaxID=2867234 RepID=A0ABS7J3B2_9SPHN|nr:hypothetical protein [Qipengyuania polymorpha]MBX7459060.1 hypothetical protein [Qipengyuania polymorpha]